MVYKKGSLIKINFGDTKPDGHSKDGVYLNPSMLNLQGKTYKIISFTDSLYNYSPKIYNEETGETWTISKYWIVNKSSNTRW